MLFVNRSAADSPAGASPNGIGSSPKGSSPRGSSPKGSPNCGLAAMATTNEMNKKLFKNAILVEVCWICKFAEANEYFDVLNAQTCGFYTISNAFLINNAQLYLKVNKLNV